MYTRRTLYIQVTTIYLRKSLIRKITLVKVLFNQFRMYIRCRYEIRWIVSQKHTDDST